MAYKSLKSALFFHALATLLSHFFTSSVPTQDLCSFPNVLSLEYSLLSVLYFKFFES